LNAGPLLRVSDGRIWRRWQPPSSGALRTTVAVAVNLLGAAVAAMVFIVLEPLPGFGHPEVLAALVAIGVVAFLAEVRLKAYAPAYFDASIVLALLALAIAGPLPALLVWALPELLARVTVRRDPIVTPGLVATLTSFALAVVAGDYVLRVAEAPSLAAEAPAICSAGLAMYAVNFCFARLTFAPFYQGFRPRGLLRSEFLAELPAALAMFALGALTLVLIPPLGVLALVPLTAAVVIPQLALEVAARRRSVARLSRTDATALYAAAIADVIGLSRFERGLVDGAAMLLARRQGEPMQPGSWGEPQLPPLTGVVAACVDERWDGSGRPFGIDASRTPVASRVLAVARVWSGLTARDTPQLSHEEAMLDLATRAGRELDPRVVEAAAQVVADESAFIGEPDFQPGLHRLPLPRPVRRVMLPSLAARLAGTADTMA
jgi:hypothetical protein